MAKIVSGGRRDRALDAFKRQGEIGIAREIARHEFEAVDDDVRARLERAEDFFAARHDHIATDHEIGAAGSDTDRVNVLRA